MRQIILNVDAAVAFRDAASLRSKLQHYSLDSKTAFEENFMRTSLVGTKAEWHSKYDSFTIDDGDL